MEKLVKGTIQYLETSMNELESLQAGPTSGSTFSKKATSEKPPLNERIKTEPELEK